MRFSGNIQAKVDAKVRVFLPSSFRKVLELAQEDTLFLRRHDYARCITLIPASVWNKKLDMLSDRLLDVKPAMANTIYRQYVKDTEELQLDGNGRFLISKSFLQFAGISQEVAFVGMDEIVEIWNPSALNESMLSEEDYKSALEDLGVL